MPQSSITGTATIDVSIVAVLPFCQELPATQEVLSRAELQPEQQGQGQEANGASPTGAS